MRSTAITASAASDAIVAPAAPSAMPTSASASAGASLIPSPTITTGARSVAGGQRAHELQLVLRRLAGVDRGRRPPPARRPRRCSRHRPWPGPRAGCPTVRRSATSPAASSRRRSDMTITATTRPSAATVTRACPGPTATSDAGCRLRGLLAATNAVLPTATRRPSTSPGDALPGVLAHAARHAQPEPAVGGRPHERRGHGVRRELVERGRDPQRLAGRQAVERDDAVDLRRAERQRPRLVEEHGARRGPAPR